MNKRKLIILLVCIVGIVSIVLIGNSNSTITGKSTEFAINDTASVTKFFLSDKNNNQILVERTNEGWLVNSEYYARPDLVKSILKTFKNITMRNPVANAGQDNAIKRMAAKSTKVEIYQNIHTINLFDKIKLFPKEELTKVYYVGDPTQNNIGTHMYMEGANKVMVCYLPGFRGYVAARYSPRLEDWRDHTIIRKNLADIQSVTIDFGRDPSNSFKVINVENKSLKMQKLVGNVEVPIFDTLRALELLTSFREISYETLLNGKQPEVEDSLRYVTPLHTITIEDVVGNQSVIKTFDRPKEKEKIEKNMDYSEVDLDRLYAFINEDKDFVLIQYFTFDKVFQPVDYYLKKKK